MDHIYIITSQSLSVPPREGRAADLLGQGDGQVFTRSGAISMNFIDTIIHSPSNQLVVPLASDRAVSVSQPISRAAPAVAGIP